MADNMPLLHKELRQFSNSKSMAKAEGHVDNIIAMLERAKDQITEGLKPPSLSCVPLLALHPACTISDISSNQIPRTPASLC